MVGGFVLAMLVGLLVLLTLLAGRTGSTHSYFTYYSDVSGLKFGTPVFFKGFLAGQIEDIEPETTNGQTVFRLTMSVESDLVVPDNSVAVIIQPNLLSGRAINIDAGSSNTALAPGSEIPAGAASGLAALPDLIGAGRGLLTQISTTVEELNQWRRSELSRVIKEYEALPVHLKAELSTISAETQALLTDSRRLILRAEHLLSPQNIESVNNTLDNVETVTLRLEEVSRDLDTLNANVQAVAVEVRNIVADNKPDIEGSVVNMHHTLESVAQRIDSITYNLEGTSRNFFEFSRQIRMNPGLLIGGSPPTDEASVGP